MLSFIIPAHNEQLYVGAAIGAIHDATRGLTQSYEIIVVDDASSDDTAASAAAGGARVVSVDERQIAAARNAGARAAIGDIFLFVDADTRINAAVVTAALAALGDGAVGGGSRFRFDGRIPFYG